MSLSWLASLGLARADCFRADARAGGPLPAGQREPRFGCAGRTAGSVAPPMAWAILPDIYQSRPVVRPELLTSYAVKHYVPSLTFYVPV